MSGFKIQRVWAFVATDPDDGDEGIPAFQTGTLMMPMVAADLKRVENLKEIAQQMADQQNMTISLRQFSEMKEIEVIKPKISLPYGKKSGVSATSDSK